MEITLRVLESAGKGVLRSR